MKTVANEISLTICPFKPKYFQAVIDFADTLPIQDLLFLPRDTKNTSNVDNWLKSIENRSVMTFLCMDGERVVGAGGVVRKLRGWSAHVAEIRLLAREDMRDRGIGRLLLKHCFAEAIEAGAEKLIGRMTADKKGAVAVFRSLGFECEAILRNQVRDNHGQLQDIIIYSYHVQSVEGAGLGYSEIY
ncbi:MAG: GNAT family N-acetyltransferase [Pseudomonadota bacterium]